MDPVANVGTTAPSKMSALVPQNQLKQGDFLNLLVAQLRYQNPLEPQDQSNFLTQLAQLQMVEQLGSLSEQMKQTQKSIQLMESSSLIGKTIQGQAADGITLVNDKVDSVFIDGKSQIWLLVGNQPVSIDSIFYVGGSA